MAEMTMSIGVGEKGCGGEVRIGLAHILYVFERYFVRTENMASLTVLFTNDGKAVTVDVIASGAGEGILNISWGANASFAKMAVDLLAKQGFRAVEG